MKNKPDLIQKRLSLMIAAVLMAGTSTVAVANDFTIDNGVLTLSTTGFTAVNTTVGTNGVITPRVTGLPVSTALGIPNFSFNLSNSASTVTNGNFEFKVGVVIFEDSTTGSTNNRLEVYLPKMVLNVNGTTVNGSIPAQTMTVVGRQGAITASAELANAAGNGPVTISGGQVTFSGANLVNRLKASNPAFNDILAAFDVAGNYTYRVVIQQTSGAVSTRFGRGTSGSFSPLPQVRTACARNTASQLSSLFALSGSVNNGTTTFRVGDQFSAAYAVQGQFSVGTPANPAAGTPTAFTDTCDNTAPTSTPPANLTAGFNRPVTGTLTATDAESDGTTFALVSATNGTATVATNGAFTFTPSETFTAGGTASFTYSVTDNFTTPASANFTTNIAVNARPTASALTVSQQQPNAALTAQALPAATVAAGTTATYALSGTAVGGTASITGGNFSFTPTANFTGNASFQYTVGDGTGALSVPYTVTIPYTAVQAPTASSGAATVRVGVAQPITLPTATVAAGRTAVYSIQNSNGNTIVLNGNVATLTASSIANNTFTYRVADSVDATLFNDYTFSLNVGPAVNQAPSGGSSAASGSAVDSDGLPGERYTFTASNWTDDQSPNLTYNWFVSVDNGTPVAAGSGATLSNVLVPDGNVTVRLDVVDTGNSLDAALTTSSLTTFTVGAPTPPVAVVSGEAVRSAYNNTGVINSMTLPLSGTVRDADGTIKSAVWEIARADQSAPTLVNANVTTAVGALATVDSVVPVRDGISSVTLVTTDNVGLVSRSTPIEVRITAPSSPIVDIASSNFSKIDSNGLAGEPVTLTAEVYHRNSTIRAIDWIATPPAGSTAPILTVPVTNFNPAGGVVTSTLNLPTDGIWTVQLRASDFATAPQTTTDSVLVDVKAPVKPVVVVAGDSSRSQISATGGAVPIILTVSGSHPNGAVSYALLEQVGGAVSEVATAPAGASGQFSVSRGPGTYNFLVESRFGTSLASDRVPVSVTVVANRAPTVQFLPVTLPTTVDANTPIPVELRIAASDTDGEVTAINWDATGADNLLVASDSRSAIVTVSPRAAANPGTIGVTVRVTDNLGAQGVAPATLTFAAPTLLVPPVVTVAQSAPGATPGIVNITTGTTAAVSFSSTAVVSTGTVTARQWSLNDVVQAGQTGETATLTLPVGPNKIEFAATANGLTRSEVTFVNVVNLAAGNNPPTVTVTPPTGVAVGGVIQVADTDGLPGQTVAFSATAVDTDPNSTIAQIRWTVNGEAQATTGANFSLPLQVGTVYNVSATAVDNFGASSSSAPVAVQALAPAAPTITITNGNRTVVDSNGLPGEVVSLNARVTDQYGPVTTGQWLIGSDVVAEGLTANVSLPIDGANTVRFRATNSVNLQSSASTVITVGAPARPTVSILAINPPAADTDSRPGELLPLVASATDADSDASTLKYEWTLNGAQIVSTRAAADVVLPDGTNTLSVRVTDIQGMSVTTSTTVSVPIFVPPPTAEQLAAQELARQQAADELNRLRETNAAAAAAAAALEAERAAAAAEALRRSLNTGGSNTAIASGMNAMAQAASASALSSGGGTETERTAINTQAGNLISTSGQVFSQMAENFQSTGVVLSVAEQNSLKQASENLLTTTASLATSVTDTTKLIELARATTQINDANAALGIVPSPAAAEQSRQASVTIATKLVDKVLADLGVSNQTAAEVRTLLANNQTALNTVLSGAINIPPSTAKSANQRQQEAQGRLPGANASLVERISAATGNVTDPTTIKNSNGQDALNAILALFSQPTPLTLLDNNGRIISVAMLAANEAKIEVDAVTGLVRVILPGETYAGAIVSIKAVPDTVPQGIRYNQNGVGLIVTNGMAIEIAPAPVDLITFAAAVEGAGFPFRFNNNASFSLDVGNGERFSGVFAYDNLTGKDLSTCGALSFGEPTGPLNSAGYAFTVKCANGIEQRVLPFIESTTFVQTFAAFGLGTSTDRNTGFVTVPTLGRFKPNFFVTTRTDAERVFHAGNRDSFGNAYQLIDLNGDGVVDMKLISNTGTQILFGVR